MERLIRSSPKLQRDTRQGVSCICIFVLVDATYLFSATNETKEYAIPNRNVSKTNISESLNMGNVSVDMIFDIAFAFCSISCLE